MKKLLVICLFFLQQANATTYYVKASGGNGNGLSDSTAWSYSKLNSTTLLPGDVVLLNRGDEFYGPLNVISGTAGKIITYGAYGTGANPIITGLSTLNSWTLSSSPNIYYTPLNVGALNVVVLDGIIRAMGRYPQTGYLSYTSHSGNSSITGSTTLPFNPTGAEVVIRKIRQITDRHIVTSYSGNTIGLSAAGAYGTNFANNTVYQPTDGNGYFIQSSIHALTKLGDWYFDTTNKLLYVYFGTDNPSTHQVQASTLDHNMEMDNKSYITFQNIDFEGANVSGTNSNNISYINFSGCNFYNQLDGMLANNGANYINVDGGNYSNILNNGIFVPLLGNYVTVDSVTLKNIGFIPGAGGSGDGMQLGVGIIGTNSTVRRCVLNNIGFHGITLNGNNTLAEKNLIDTYGVTKDDCGGIYDVQFAGVTNSNKIIRNNIILNGIGVAAGAPPYAPFGEAAGIYLDNTNNVQVYNNSISKSVWGGILVVGISFNNQIVNNHVFDSQEQLYLLNTPNVINLLTVSGNQFVAKTDTETTMSMVLFTSADNPSVFGSFKANDYDRPMSDSTSINIDKNYTGGNSVNLSLATWQSTYNMDLLSKKSPIIYPPYYVGSVNGANLFTNSNFDTNISGTSVTGNGAISWATNSNLSGGALKVVNTGTSYVATSTGAVVATKQYDLKFTALSSIAGTLKVYLNGPGAKLTPISTINLTTKATQYECLFSYPTAASASSLVFEMDNQSLTYWLDSIQLYDANVTIINPDDFMLFEYNASDNNETFTLAEDYVDPDNVTYSGSVVLQPYTSLILMKKYCVQPPTPTIQSTSAK